MRGTRGRGVNPDAGGFRYQSAERRQTRTLTRRKPFTPLPCPMAESCFAPAPVPVARPTVRPYHAVDYR